MDRRLSERPDDTLFDEQGQAVQSSAIDALVANVECRCDPGNSVDALRHGRAPFGPAHVSDTHCGCSANPRRYRHRSLPGERAVPRHAGRDRAREPRRRVVVRREPALRGLDSKQRRGRGCARTKCSATRTRRRTSSSPARRRTRCSRRSGRKFPSCSWRWVCAFPCSPTGRPSKPVNGQHPYTAHVVELPMRDAGWLAAVSRRHCCRRPRTSPSDYLPLTRANLLRQSFKFLGERYGWGHSYNARDCSGFVSEVYRSFGVQIAAQYARPGREPRAESHRVHRADDDHETRLAVLRELQVGDLDLHSGSRHDGDRPRTAACPTSSTTRPASPIATPTARSRACT